MNLRRTSTLVLIICVIGIVARLAVAIELGDAITRATDEYSYAALAARVASGYGYSFAEAWYPFTAADTPTAHWSFLYTAYLAGIYTVAGHHPIVARVIQAVLGGVLLPWLVFRLARRAIPEPPFVGFLAAACAAGYAFFILYAARLMTETFYIAAVLWSLERALALAETKTQPSPTGKSPAWRWGTALTLGVALGLASLLRQSILPWLVALFGWLLYSRVVSSQGTLSTANRKALLELVGAAAVALTFIVPITVRNYFVYGEFLLLNSNAGYAMYSAQHPMHKTDFKAFAAAPLPLDLLGEDLNEAEWDRELMRRGIGFVLADPIRYLQLSASRAQDYFEFWPTDTTFLHNAGRLLSFTIFLPFYVAGIWRVMCRARHESGGWRRLFAQPPSLLLLFIIFYSLLHIFTWAMPRYRLPVDAVAMPFAAFSIWELLAFLRGRFPAAGAQLARPSTNSGKPNRISHLSD